MGGSLFSRPGGALAGPRRLSPSLWPTCSRFFVREKKNAPALRGLLEGGRPWGRESQPLGQRDPDKPRRADRVCVCPSLWGRSLWGRGLCGAEPPGRGGAQSQFSEFVRTAKWESSSLESQGLCVGNHMV